jgi:hypothetical protein
MSVLTKTSRLKTVVRRKLGHADKTPYFGLFTTKLYVTSSNLTSLVAAS